MAHAVIRNHCEFLPYICYLLSRIMALTTSLLKTFKSRSFISAIFQPTNVGVRMTCNKTRQYFRWCIVWWCISPKSLAQVLRGRCLASAHVSLNPNRKEWAQRVTESLHACCCYWIQQVASRKEESPIEELVWINHSVSACPISALHTSVKKNHMLIRTHSHVCPNNHSRLTHWLYTWWPCCKSLMWAYMWWDLTQQHTHTDMKTSRV